MAALRFDLSEVMLSLETRALLPLHAGEAPLREQRQFGTWWMAPFARMAMNGLLGFRMIPGVRLVEGPVVWTSGPAAVTVASRVDRVVPLIVFAQMVSAPHRWKDAAALLDGEWDELRQAHHALGGTDELEALRAVALDEALRAACAQSGALRDKAATAVLEQLDPSPATTAFRRSWLAVIAGRPLPLVENAGCWAAALDALACDDGDERDPRGEALAAAWRRFQHPAGLDVGWSHSPNEWIWPWPAPAAVDAARRLHVAARRLVTRAEETPSQWRDDPLWAAIAALAAAPSSFDYRGVEFMEAAAALDERGESERALHTLTAVEFWNFLAGGPSLAPAIDAAHALASRHGWAHIEAMTEAVISGRTSAA
jgi:hypothetical protein